jgi:flap endonuclease GEN
MTVSSLWKVLDQSGCGVAVGTQDLLDPDGAKQSTNPWNCNDKTQRSSSRKRPALAVDLSIWICEGLTSPAIASNHTNPALHLAYTRAMKLLGLGIKLVIVIEGKRRVRRTEEPDKFQRRRSGTAFWKACKACEEMFGYMGVPVVKAKAEGEALCALLNQRKIVDGVISNDGDCLLFGAKVVYTKFSNENLDNGQVIRYDSSELKALVEKESDENREEESKISLSRHDLISFALLTGSDLAGNGLPNVGHKKAVRFIYKCKHDHPLSPDTAAIDELRSWARTAKVLHDSSCDANNVRDDSESFCSLCNHPGDKRCHLKNGCETCGTQPGEPCFAFTGSDRFRQSLREKALALEPKFAPAMVVDAYLKPNNNQLPLLLDGTTSATLEMNMPCLDDFLASKLIVKGQSHDVSRDFVVETLSRLLIRRDLFGDNKKHGTNSIRRALSKNVPKPSEITRRLVRDRVQCFEISWSVQATVTDSDGNDVDGYEFSTIEPQELVKKRYPDLVTSFEAIEIEQQKQGDAERTKRKEFLETLLNGRGVPNNQTEDEGKKGRKKVKKKRNQENFFQGQRAKQAGRTVPTGNIVVGETDEMKAIMRRFEEKKKQNPQDFDFSTIASGSLRFQIGDPTMEGKKKKQYGKPKERLHQIDPVGMMVTVFKPTTAKTTDPHKQSEDGSKPVGFLEAPGAVDIDEPKRQLERKFSQGGSLKHNRGEEINGTLTKKMKLEQRERLEGDSDSIEVAERSGMMELDESQLDKEDKVPGLFDYHCYQDNFQSKVSFAHMGASHGMDPNIEHMHSKEGANVFHTAQPLGDPQLLYCCQGGTVEAANANFLLQPDSGLKYLGGKSGVDLTEGLPIEKREFCAPLRVNKVKSRADPDAWMARVIVRDDDASLTGDEDARRCLEFDFDRLMLYNADEGSIQLPALTADENHLVVCDMGIPVQVSPMISRKRDRGVGLIYITYC